MNIWTIESLPEICQWFNFPKYFVGTSKFTHSQDAVFKVDTLRDESFITGWGGGGGYIQGMGSEMFLVMYWGVENKMTYGQGVMYFVRFWGGGGQMCSIGLSFH